MTHREGEPAIFLDVPRISIKTPNEILKKWSSQFWPSDRRKSVARDMVNNGKELLLGSNADWGLVLDSISVVREYNSFVQFGKDAIAANGARFIGGLAARAGWSMHDPPAVYLSGKYLAHIAKLEDFKITMIKRALSYGQKTLPEAELLMPTLDLLLEHPDIRKHSQLVTRITALLQNGDIQGAYTIVSSLEHPVSRRGLDFSKTTTSSILTPPSPGI